MPKLTTHRPSKSKELPERTIRFFGIHGLPEIQPGDNLPKLVAKAARAARFAFESGDILVIAQKIVSKSEGRTVSLSTVTPSAEALSLSATVQNDPRMIEVILRESRRIVRKGPHALIVETHHGFVCANAGVDRSNVPGDDVVTLLPKDPDGSALHLADALRKRTGKRLAVIISDTFGRPWRLGLTNVAIGAAGVPALLDLRGTRDRSGKSLHATILALADELAAAAGLAMGKTAGVPAVVIRGYRYRPSPQNAASIIRPAKEDLFR
jgi:coenzyme F420-0:L-glutamate ligase / coenzyme F420-1:gamma-L-glutamate ligase